MSEERNLSCPKCQAKLRTVEQEGAEVDLCEKCGGVWVDRREEKAVLQIKPAVFTLEELRQMRKNYASLGRVEELKYYPCPVCQNMMWRKNWGAHSGVIVDRCSEHGAWYDEGEIEKVREFILAGGIEFEKMRATEKGLARLESKQTQESLRLDQRINSAYARARMMSFFGF